MPKSGRSQAEVCTRREVSLGLISASFRPQFGLTLASRPHGRSASAGNGDALPTANCEWEDAVELPSSAAPQTDVLALRAALRARSVPSTPAPVISAPEPVKHGSPSATTVGNVGSDALPSTEAPMSSLWTTNTSCERLLSCRQHRRQQSLPRRPSQQRSPLERPRQPEQLRQPKPTGQAKVIRRTHAR